MEKKNDKNIHAGHRQRLVETIINGGLENLSEIQIMEYICTLIIPRKDVNPVAHALLNEFGSITNVLEAEHVYLAKVAGVSVLAAKKLSIFRELFDVYKNKKINNSVILKDMKSIYEYVHSVINFYDNESVYLVALDAKDKIIALQKTTGNHKETLLPTNELCIFISKFRASKLLIFHNHPNGNSKPSDSDINSTNAIEQYCKILHTTLADHIIVGKDEIFSFKKCIKIKLEDIYKD